MSFASRGALLLLALCLLFSALPCMGFEPDGACDLCEQDDLIAGPSVPIPMGLALLLERPNVPRIAPPASLAQQFPHPPTF